MLGEKLPGAEAPIPEQRTQTDATVQGCFMGMEREKANKNWAEGAKQRSELKNHTSYLQGKGGKLGRLMRRCPPHCHAPLAIFTSAMHTATLLFTDTLT